MVCFYLFFLVIAQTHSINFRLAAMLLAVVLQRKTAARAQENPLVILVLHSLCRCNKKNDQTTPPNAYEVKKQHMVSLYLNQTF